MLNSKGSHQKKFRSYFIQKCFELIHSSYKSRANGGADDYGNKWRNTKKRKKGKANQIMVNTGKLINSYRPGSVSKSSYSKSSSDQLVKITDKQITLGSLVPYANLVKRNILPARLSRKVISIATNYALNKIVKELETDLNKAARKRK